MHALLILSLRCFQTKFCLLFTFIISILMTIIILSYYNDYLHESNKIAQISAIKKSHLLRNWHIDDDNDDDDHDDDDDDDDVVGNYISQRNGKHVKRKSLLGEHGVAATLNSSFIIAGERSINETGFNAILSDQISLERSLPDVRHKSCRSLLYYNDLPSVSIIIVYHNEHASILLRTLYSLLNRTPDELLHEIILVDDFSDLGGDRKSFAEVLKQHQRLQKSNKIKILRLDEHSGLIRARILGARNATAQVLIFLDAHIEATKNWLPPLLQPIVDNPKTCTTPIIDTIRYDSFEYAPGAASRGGFNWQFNYVELPLLSAEQMALPAPHNNPVMNGGLFAIASKFFWHLGAYDDGLLVWGVEQFELSFKIWMCGGRLLEVPCSRMGHLYRDSKFRVKYTDRRDDFITKNYKRVAEVWMDEYKDVLYEHVPKLMRTRAGDVSSRKALRQRLQCNTFKWYLHTIAPDLLEAYPTVEPTDFAYGAIQSLAAPQLCLDTLNKAPRHISAALEPCSPDLQHPYATQRWHLGFRRNIHQQGNCLEVQTWSPHAPVWLWPCHNRGGNQFWYYDRQTQMIVHGARGEMEQRCLEANVRERRAYVNFCDFTNRNMKWHFGYVNETALNIFFKGLRKL